MKMWLHLNVLVRNIHHYFGAAKEKFKVCSSKMAANLSLLLKVEAGEQTGSKHLTSLSGML